jgi:hypothetical protein
MSISSTATLILVDTIGGIIKNLPYFILIVWGIRVIAREMPKWISQMFAEMHKQKVLEKALEMKI